MHFYELNEEESKKAVFTFGRLNPPHYGHGGMIDTLQKAAREKDANWFLFVSSKTGDEKNPLTYEQKIAWIQTLFPETKGHLVVDPSIKTPLVAATWLYKQGYRAATFVAGEDDMGSYGEMIKSGNAHGIKNPDAVKAGKGFIFNPLDFAISPRLASATNARKNVTDGDPEAFVRSILGPKINPQLATLVHDQLYPTIRKALGLTESVLENKLLNKKTPGIKNLAKKYVTSASDIQRQLAKGIKVEFEHSNDIEIAREIALDHLGERLDYYDLLAKVEKSAPKTEAKTKSKKKKFSWAPYWSYYWGGSTGSGEGSDNAATESINEVADQPYRFMLTKKTDSGNWYMFETDNGIRMVVSATLDPLPNGTFSTEIAFSEYDAKNMDPTGKGDAFRIFATVGAIVKEFLRSGKPQAQITEIYFTGKTKEPSRIKLYDMIAKNISRFLPNFEFKNTVEQGREKYYHFKKVTAASESQVSESWSSMELAIMEGGHSLDDYDENLTETLRKVKGKWALTEYDYAITLNKNTIAEDYKDAAKYAAGAHAGQTRSGGKPYISHPVRVANLVRKYKDSKELDKLLSAAFLHDTIEDTDTTEEQLRKMFGDLVATLVKELTSDKEKIEKLGKEEYLTQKMIHMSSWGLVIKLADRLDNVADIKTAKTPEWRQRYRTETENILTQLEQNRKLSGTHKKIMQAIRGKLAEIDESYINEADEDTVKPLVYLDMDGVLADFFGEWSRISGVDNYKDIDDVPAKLQLIREHPTFWTDLPLLPNAKALIKTVINNFGEYRICSKPLEGDPRSKSGKLEWIRTHLSDMPPAEIILTHDKAKFAKLGDSPNVLVDDYGKNVNDWRAAGGIALQYQDQHFSSIATLLEKLSK